MTTKPIISWCCLIMMTAGDLWAGAMRFEEFYNLPFYKNNWTLSGLVTMASVATVGSGVPALAIGVSSLSSTMAGAGAGSYLREVGGNETVGNAFLNALSFGVEWNIGKALSTSTLMALKSVQAGGMGAILMNNRSEIHLRIIPPDIEGSEAIRDALQHYRTLQEGLAGQSLSALEYDREQQAMADRLVVQMRRTEDREDLVVGAVMLYGIGRHQEFGEVIDRVTVLDETESYLYFLKAVAATLRNDLESAEILVLKSIRAEPEVIEPKMLYMIILDDMGKHEKLRSRDWVDRLLAGFDRNHYNTPNSLASAYTLAGDLAVGNKEYQTALYYHERAYDAMGLLSSWDDKALLCLKIALDHKRLDHPEQVEIYYRKAMFHVSDDRLRAQIEETLNPPPPSR
ncbi:MAG: hypothetical protein HQM03_10810 [Magnetococcales bacterium]|nr:hypothetical protein [Magnetococcales bacterium]